MWRHQKSCSASVKQALNTRPWLVNALVTWHDSYKVRTLKGVRIFPRCPCIGHDMFPTNQFSYNVPLSKATRNHELIIAHNENPTRTRKSKRNSAKLDFTELREASKPKKMALLVILPNFDCRIKSDCHQWSANI